MTSLALNFAPNPFALQEIYFWMLGSLSNRSSNELFFAFTFYAFRLDPDIPTETFFRRHEPG